jgi:hypothetical protein
MKPKWIWEFEFCNPWIQKAKAKDIKLTRKNHEKLHDAWINYCYKHFGLNGLFKATYGPAIKEMIQQPSILMSMMRKDDCVGSPLYFPIPLDKSTKE